jgi:hypothetical protein
MLGQTLILINQYTNNVLFFIEAKPLHLKLIVFLIWGNCGSRKKNHIVQAEILSSSLKWRSSMVDIQRSSGRKAFVIWKEAPFFCMGRLFYQ